ncbi:isochorismate synthase [Humibacter ginsenosidimutans]|uniref:isochorismate synthase n=1 Tax=Humibacter ginsenosidimutans TaxID=2599293 RepID=UPI00143D5E53|nr:isochorismate synthase [Humibacter ginsenosidimutans]
MTVAATRVQALTVETTLLDDVRHIIPFADAHTPLLWLRKGEGIAGVGEALRLEFRGADRIAQASAAWKQLAAASTVTDQVRMPGTGLVAFGTFAFDDDSAATSVLIVPAVIIGRRDGRSWITRIRRTDDKAMPAAPHTEPFGAEYRLTMLPGALTREAYKRAVGEAVQRIRQGDLEKVVLARDLRAHLPIESDVRRALVELALGYPECWTYAVDGMVGSSPETLVRVHRGTLDARVLAGTSERGRDADSDHESAAALLASAKDLQEHEVAVRSVITSLTPHTSALTTSESPFPLKLPNLWHLATDVSGTLSDGSGSLDLVSALHPTAAVAGTPTDAALQLIRELEPFDRERYAGPVGWIGTDGDGEWAIALRCAQVKPSGDITAYAGCGIMADSVPERELAETKMKFRPITEAFG